MCTDRHPRRSDYSGRIGRPLEPAGQPDSRTRRRAEVTKRPAEWAEGGGKKQRAQQLCPDWGGKVEVDEGARIERLGAWADHQPQSPSGHCRRGPKSSGNRFLKVLIRRVTKLPSSCLCPPLFWPPFSTFTPTRWPHPPRFRSQQIA
ncbi:unnamed protein product [Protopolystoma xenopodis]|uniref:Uncharacterized protein n=1 Tax=Protopolystoma xenopodis TaxID=117903 RepID=A0A3S5C745_9PLAT|nr:unnamed protein product [Protopolystoma xenopodis]